GTGPAGRPRLGPGRQAAGGLPTKWVHGHPGSLHGELAPLAADTPAEQGDQHLHAPPSPAHPPARLVVQAPSPAPLAPHRHGARSKVASVRRRSSPRTVSPYLARASRTTSRARARSPFS